MRRSSAVLASVVTAVLASGLLAGTASAEVHAERDARRDVQVERNYGEPEPHRTNRSADLVVSRVDHRRDELRLGARVREMVGSDAANLNAWWTLKLPDGPELHAVLNRSNGRLYPMVESESGVVDCEGLAGEIRGDTYRLVIPTSCLGRPRWVRVATEVRVQSPAGLRLWRDIAGRDGLANHPVYGPRVRRG